MARLLFPVPQTSKSRQMSIRYFRTTECFRESIGVELRICPRARDRTHIDEQIDVHLLEQTQEFGDRTRRMTYREDRRYLLGRRSFCYHYKNYYIRAAAPVVEPAGLNLDLLRPRRSVIANDVWSANAFGGEVCDNRQRAGVRYAVSVRYQSEA